MESPVINARSDLDAIAGTPAHVAFMARLAATLWRFERDDDAQTWVAVEDNSTIERFGFSRADFPGAQPPAQPEYVTPATPAPPVVTMRQARLALLGSGMADQVNQAIASIPGDAGAAARIEWEYAQEIRRDSPLLLALSAQLQMTDAQIDALFVSASNF